MVAAGHRCCVAVPSLEKSFKAGEQACVRHFADDPHSAREASSHDGVIAQPATRQPHRRRSGLATP